MCGGRYASDGRADRKTQENLANLFPTLARSFPATGRSFELRMVFDVYNGARVDKSRRKRCWYSPALAFLRDLRVSVVNSSPQLDSPRRHGDHGEQKIFKLS